MRTLRVRVPKVTGDGVTWKPSMLKCAGEVMLAIGTVPPFVVQPFEAGVVVVVGGSDDAAITAVCADDTAPTPSAFVAVTLTRIVLPAFVFARVNVECPLFGTPLHAPPFASHCFQL